MARIVIIGTTQLSLNPRLVKEADALSAAGHDVSVLHQYWNAWGAAAERELLQSAAWQHRLIGGSPDRAKIAYWRSRALHKIGRAVAARFAVNDVTARAAISRASSDLATAAWRIPADLYIAHTLGALPAAAKAAKEI